jgi:general nucleoside transport system permease protein
VEGQLFVGSVATVIVGTKLIAPAFIQLPVTLLAGVLAGALWAAIPGFLKAKYGANEVITTIMTNYIAIRIITWSIGARGPLRKAASVVPETNSLFETARLPTLIPDTRLHAGILIALLMAGLIYLLLFRTTLGIEIRTVGLNLHAAQYAGIHVNRTIVLTMALSGALAGMAGAVQVMGLPPYNFTTGFNVGYGFDSIAVAVLGSIHPFGITFSAFLFGAMDAGARLMQLRARVPIEMINILQGLILMFVAANQIIRGLYRIRVQKKEEFVNLTQSWSGGQD